MTDILTTPTRAAVVVPDDAAPIARNATLDDLADALQRQHDAKVDMVAPARCLRSALGNLVVTGADPVLTGSGVTLADGTYRPTTVADEGIADKLRIPLAYLRRMRNELPGLYDENVNAWLRQDPERRFLLRAFRGDDASGAPGVLRALLSDSYKRIDNYDVLIAALSGIQEAGQEVTITGCDLTERRMIVRVESDAVRVLAPQLLKGYRSPFDRRSGDELPIVSAGFVLANSEVGAGAFSITPRIVVQVCRNGMTVPQDAMRAVHMGAKLEEGVIRWSGDTDDKNLALVTAQARDVVTTFLDRAYVERKLADIERAAGREIADPAKTVETIAKKLRFTEDVRSNVLNHFIRGGQTTAGSILHAVTSVAQTLSDADAAYELEAQGLAAMQLAAA
jgi:hypothetical protein